MKSVFSLGAVLSAAAAFALPSVDPATVTLAQDAAGKVTIGYTLADEPAIVTIDIQTNAGANAWASIGDKNLRGFAGAANRLLPAGTYAATWQPGQFWGGPDVESGNLRAVVSAWSTNDAPDYVVFDLATKTNVFFYTSAETLPRDLSDPIYRNDWLVLRRCHAAGLPWRRGTPSTEYQRRTEPPQCEEAFVCTISEDYYLAVFELTVGQWKWAENAWEPDFSNDPDAACLPVHTMSWESLRGKNATFDWPTKGHDVDDASMLGKIRARLNGYAFDLPTVAQWEFACRAGTVSAFSNGGEDGKHDVQAVGWVSENAEGGLHPVGTKPANPWGFYDMHGNASEWCLDYMTAFPVRYGENGPDACPCDHSYITGSARVIRGGGFVQSGTSARSGTPSDWSQPDLTSDHPAQVGCRLCLPAVFH